MKRDKLLVVVRVDGKDVFNQESMAVTDWGVAYIEVPTDVIPKDYSHMQIEIYRDGGDK